MTIKAQNRLPHTRDPFQTLFTRLFGDQLGDFYGAEGQSAAAPRTNIAETDKSYELAFELPGVAEDDIQVQLHDKVLTIRAERRDTRASDAGDNPENGRRWHRVEHRYGEFTRAISLPQDAANDGIEAVYEAGVLTVTVPKQPEAQPARITVRRA